MNGTKAILNGEAPTWTEKRAAEKIASTLRGSMLLKIIFWCVFRRDDNLSTFVELVKMSGLDVSLEFADNFTVFMPTNEAFVEMEVRK